MKNEQIIQPLSMLAPSSRILEHFGAQPDYWIGRSIGDRQRYRLEKCLGEGSMGYVFLAIDTVLGKQVAVKLLKDTLRTSAELRQRFEREVKVCAALESNHIVDVSDYGVTAEDLPFYVMEYLRGQSLGKLLHQQRRLPVERTVNIITQVCDGLCLAHKGVTLRVEKATVSEYIQVVHRDLKPDNIFLVPTVQGELVKILDFGIAKIRESQEYTQLTCRNTFIGTYHYAAPEQLEGAENIDGRADIYSLGIILYKMLSGTDPFGLGLNTREISAPSWTLAHHTRPVQPLRSQPGLSDLSPQLEAAVLRCLAKAPSDRFTSVNDLKEALQNAITVETVSVSTPIPQHHSEDKTTLRPLAPVPPKFTKPTNINKNLTFREPSGDRTIEQPVKSVDLGVSGTVLSLEKDSLLEIITEIVGPIASTLVEEVAAQASSTKELVNELLPYLCSSQQIEFEKKAMLLQKPVAQTQTRTEQAQAIDIIFLQQCEEYLAEVIGPIASLLIQEVIESHPQIFPVELVNVLAKEIPNPKQVKDFFQHFTG